MSKKIILLPIIFIFSLVLPRPVQALMSGQLMVDPDSKSWLVYNRDSDGDGKKDPFFLSGAGGPEGFLYGDISGTNQDGVINFMIQNGYNGLYVIAVRTKDGGPNQVPWPGTDKTKLDETKMNNWHNWFKKMSDNGIAVVLFFYDDGEPHAGDAFIRNIVNRFEDIPLLIWVVAEEYSEGLSKTAVNSIINIIKNEDAHRHPIAVHQLSGLNFDFAGSADQFAIQSSGTNFNAQANTAWNNAAGRYNLNFAEQHALDVATVSNDAYRRGIWGLAMGGGYTMQLGTWETSKGRKPPTVQMANASRGLVKFFESTNFNKMSPGNTLAGGSTQYVLSGGGNYIFYSANASGAMGVSGLTAGSYSFQWYDIINNKTVSQSGISVGSGSQSWNKPSGITSGEVAVYLKRSGTPVTVIPTPTVKITATPTSAVNQAPKTLNASYAAVAGKSLEITLVFQDSDGPGPYTYTITQQPQHGTLSGDNNDRVYTASAGFSGTDSFKWIVNDNLIDSNIATITLNVGSSPTVSGKQGDANGDDKVDGLDYVIWLNNYNNQATGAASGDFDGNGKVDGLDYVIWLNNYNK